VGDGQSGVSQLEMASNSCYAMTLHKCLHRGSYVIGLTNYLANSWSIPPGKLPVLQLVKKFNSLHFMVPKVHSPANSPPLFPSSAILIQSIPLHPGLNRSV